ncbi:gliding motility lipoprotein GldD [Robertkochia solimangrovi]|uniref:gliding motility lipoprotein GldD n=1 Tax=Robertkochia solimangrovi TaxID=2213046 RepID=UPI00117EDF18|nr:gliding motility lipoprotein GldD [Robertkochia solimangrovi]TRZ45803.1 gliding motility lipoprotein GldD [Robertkochia solimangrovi]
MFRKLLILSVAVIFVSSCGDAPVPKPKATLRLEYPAPLYSGISKECPFDFEQNKAATLENFKDCSFNLDYKGMNAKIYITYKAVDGDLDLLLRDAQKLTYEHVVKADNITEQPFINDDKGVYGMFYMVRGNAASQSQFYLTDSTRNFVTGSLYFSSKPNYDSIMPAAAYLEDDIRHLMESFTWN